MKKTYPFIEEKAIELAKEDKSIMGLSIGNCPEEKGIIVYYFMLGNGNYNRKRTDSISALELETSGCTDKFFRMTEWPVDDVDDAVKKYSFLGEVIWRRL